MSEGSPKLDKAKIAEVAKRLASHIEENPNKLRIEKQLQLTLEQLVSDGEDIEVLEGKALVGLLDLANDTIATW